MYSSWVADAFLGNLGLPFCLSSHEIQIFKNYTVAEFKNKILDDSA